MSALLSSTENFKILCHNVFWFQGAPFLTDTPGAPVSDILEQLCAFYRRLKPDVVCLQEIQSFETFKRVSDFLEMPGCYTPGKDLPQYGGATFWRPNCGRMIHRSDEAAKPTQRMWQIVEVTRARRRFRICNIHLPSGRQIGAERAAAQRVSEMQDAIESCESGPDIIAGDFNERAHDRVSLLLKERDYADAALLSGLDECPTNIGGKRGDFIWLKRELSNCFLSYGVATKQEMACENLPQQYLSDHLPLWTAIRE